MHVLALVKQKGSIGAGQHAIALPQVPPTALLLRREGAAGVLHLTLRMQFMLSSASSKSPRYISPFRVSMVTIVPCSPKAHQATVSASSEYVTHKSSSPHASSSNRITHLRIVQQDYWDAHPSLASHRHILCSSTSSDRHDTENEEMLGRLPTASTTSPGSSSRLSVCRLGPSAE